MFRVIKNIIKIAIVILGILGIAIILFLYIYVYKNDANTDKIKDNGNVTFSILLYGSEKLFPNRLDAYTVLYDKQTNILKILSINTDTVIFKNKEKTRSLKIRFNQTAKKDLRLAIEQFHLDLRETLESTYKASFYINTSFEMLNAIASNKEFGLLIAKNNFENKDLESLNRYETIEGILDLMPYKILNLYKNHRFLDTNISLKSLIVSVLRIKSLKPTLMFCDLPVKYTNARVEPDRQNIREFLSKIYHINLNSQAKTKAMLIEIKNASKKPQVAQKSAWLLRDNKFDVLDWNNFSVPYEKTLIKDYKGNFYQALRITQVLKTGKVIVSYNNKIHKDIDVFLGRDCIVCDSLDKKGCVTAKIDFYELAAKVLQGNRR
jgi:hypothetical protein